MCLQALRTFAPTPPFSVLDVGSGTGILAIAAAKLGARATGIDIDPAANAAAANNARLSGVADRVRFGTEWPEETFEIVVANILRGVLLELAPPITARAAQPACLVLAGLVSTDVPEVIARYAPLLGGARPEIFGRELWRALVWRAGA